MRSTGSISIIIPLLYPDKEFYRLLHSLDLISDKFAFIEVLVISKATFDIPQSLRGFPNLNIVAESGKGIYAAMNQGLKLARGDYLYFIGKDDFVFPTFAKLSGYISSGADIILFDTVWGDGNIYVNRSAPLLLLYRNWCHQGVVYRRKLIESESVRFPKVFRTQADHYVNIRLAWNKKVSVKRLDLVCAYYSASGYSSHVMDDFFRLLFPVIVRKYCGRAFAAVLVCLRFVRRR